MKKLIKLLIAVMCVLVLAAGVIGCVDDVPNESGSNSESNPTESVSASDSLSTSESNSQSESTHTHVFTAITVKTQPSKTVYLVGDLFDKTGMVVEGTCECGTATITDYEIVYADGATSLKYGDTSVTVRYGKLTTSVAVTVEKRTVEKPVADETVFTYNGSKQTYTIAASEFYTVSGNEQTNAGEYVVTVELKDKEHTVWADNSTKNLTYTFTIAKLNAEVVWTTADEYVYKDTALVAPTAKIVGADGNDIGLTVTGDEITGKGEFTFIATTDNENYALTNTTCKITVKLYNEITGLKFENVKYGDEPAYDKAAVSAVHGTPVLTYATEEKGEYVAWETAEKKVGTYYVKAYVEGTDEYVSAVAYATFEVAKADVIATVTVADIKCKETPAPSATVSASDGEISYSYAAEENGEYGAITDFVAGTYYVKAHVAATENYNECNSAAVAFTVSHDHKWVKGETNDEKKCACGDISETINTVLVDRQIIDLDISTSGLNGEKTVELDLAAVGNYKSATKVVFNGSDISDSASVAVNAFDYAYGEKELTVTVLTNDDVSHTITLPALLVTKVIKTADDYANWIKIAKACESDASLWGGYFMLGNDISAQTMVTFARTSINGSNGFKGTFDGNGYAIDGLNKADNASTAFISCMTSEGVLKNVSFTSAKFSVPNGNFLCSGGRGLIENVYVKYAAITDGNTGGWSGTITNRNLKAYTTTKSVFIDASEAKISGNGLYFRLLGANIVDSNADVVPDGMFAICSENYTVSQATPSMVAGKIYAYASFDDLKADTTAMSVIKNFDTDFWTIKEDGTPEPKNLPKMVKLNDCEADLDITVENGTAKVSTKELAVDYDASSVNFGTVSAFKFDGVELDNSKVVVADGTVTIALSAFGFNYGVHSVTIEDINGNILSFNVDIITKTIMNATDYSNWIIIAKACENASNLWGGNFRLGANIADPSGNSITMVTFSRDIGSFKGTFDGCGYAIDKLNKADNGVTAFISSMTSEGVLKNIAFTNAEFTGTNGAFLCRGGSGTIQNVYVSYGNITNGGQYVGTVISCQNGTLKGIFIDASNATISGTGNTFKIVASDNCNGYGGIFAIIPTSENGYTTPSNALGRLNNYEVVAYFADAAEMRANETTQAKIAGWDKTYWNIVDGVPQFIVK